jgi:hypothetical protein
MALLYADTSAIVSAYFADEPDHRGLNRMLLVGNDPVVTSELSLVEFGRAVAAAYRKGRITDPKAVMAGFVSDCAEDGVFSLLTITSGTTLPLARKLVLDHPIRTLDAIHLATALTRGRVYAGTDDFAMVTRDQRQATVAKACGMRVL